MKDYVDENGFHYKELYWEDLRDETKKELAKLIDLDDWQFDTFPIASIPYNANGKSKEVR